MDQAPAPDGAPDMSGGYVIELYALPDGTFRVEGPEPMAEQAAEGEGDSGSGETAESAGDALKAVLMILRDNPLGGDGKAQMEAGFNAG